MSNLLVSLCNLPASGMPSLLRIDTRSGEVLPLRIGSGFPIRTCTGLALDAERIYAMCCDTAYSAHLSVLSRHDYSPVFSQALPEAADPHSILIHCGRLYVCCTQSDAVLAYDILPDRVANPETIWSVHGGNAAAGRDTHHVNSIALWNGDVVISAFGPRSGQNWSSATKGYLYNLSQRTLLAENLCQPHSLRAWNGELHYCESAHGRVARLGQTGRVFGAYTRGLQLLGDGIIAFGSSVARRQSKSTGLIHNPADPGDASGSCAVSFFRFAASDGASVPQTIALDSYGTEIYDLVCLEDDLPGAATHVFDRCSQANTPGQEEGVPAGASAVSARCTVIVPVFDAFDELVKCLQSLKAHLPAYANLLLVDDASRDARIAPLLARLAQEWPAQVRVLSIRSNLGFPGAVNHAIEHCAADDDIVILNSDTMVTCGWLSRLRKAFDAKPSAGIACPLSNNGTILSVPRFNQSQEMPPAHDADSFRELTSRAVHGMAEIELPTAVGFCMYVRRAVIDAIGLLDPAFGRGYGEECDFSMRARQAGFGIVCAPDAFVYHRGESSFGNSRRNAIAKQINEQALYARWPAYRPAVISFCRENPLRAAAERIWHEIQQTRSGKRRGVLHVLHRGGSGGGVENHVRDLSLHCRNWSPQTILLPRTGSALWSDLEEIDYSNGVRTVGLCLHPPAGAAVTKDAEIRFARFLRAHPSQIVHFHHLIGWNSLELPALAKRDGKAVVLSIHDYAHLCPNYNFGRDNGRSCTKTAHVPGDTECERCLARFAGNEDVGKLKPAPGLSLIEKTREIFSLADAVLFPSEFALQRYRRALGSGYDGKLLVIPHSGLTQPPPPLPAAAAPVEAAQRAIRVTFFGAFNFAKGADLFLAAARRLSGKGFAFNIVGNVYHMYEKAVGEARIPYSGSYEREELPALLARTDVVCILSRWDETYCLAFDEAMASGKIVIAAAAGALPERFVKDEFSFLIEPNQYQTLVDTLLQVQRIELHARLPVQRAAVCTVADSPYLQLYRKLATCAADKPAAATHRAAWESIPLTRNDYADWCRARTAEALTESAAAPECETEIDCLVDCRAFPELAAATIADLERLGASSIHLIGAQPIVEGVASPDLNSLLPRLDRRWVLMIQAGDRLAPDFFEAVKSLVRESDTALIYWDEDLRSERGMHYQALHKPPFDPLLFGNRPDLLGDCALLKRSALLELGGVERVGSDSLAGFAAKLAASRCERTIRHVARVCSHRSDIRHWAQARTDALVGQPRSAAQQPAPARPTVRVILMIRDTGSLSPNLADQYLNQQQVKVVCIDPWLIGREGAAAQEFNHPRISEVQATVSIGAALRAAATSPREDFLLLCSAAVSVPNLEFVASLIKRLAVDDGIAGPAIADANGTLVSSGVLLGGGGAGVAAFLGLGAPPGEGGHFGLLHEDRRVGALSDEFALIRRETLHALQFDSGFDHHYSLVDFCIRARQAGWHSVCAGSMRALRRPSSPHPDADAKQRTLDALEQENERMLAKWGAALAADPAHNSNLSLQNPIPVPDLRFAVHWNAKPKKGLRVVAAPFDQWGSGKYRVDIPLAALRKCKQLDFIRLPEHSSGYLPSVSELRRADADTLLIHNPFHDYQIEALRIYKKHLPIRIVAGMDDLLTALPHYNPYAKTIYPDLVDRMRRALAHCDSLVVSSAALQLAYAGLIERIDVIPNAIDTAAWRLPDARPRSGRKVRVGWAGANQHGGDLSLIADLVRSTSDSVDWVFLGMRPDQTENCAEFHPMVSFSQYPSRLAALHLDLALAPLLDNPFNRAKSNLKLLEYGICGVPVLCSDIEPYRDAPVWRVGNDPNAWRDRLLELSAEPDALQAAGNKLRAWVTENHTIEARRAQWLSALGNGATIFRSMPKKAI